LRKSSFALVVAAALGATAATVHAESRKEWIDLGTRVHGGFGAFIPAGIGIGLDALERLKAGPREITVLYVDGDKAPCACFADGVMLATVASPGQRTLQIAGEKAPPGALAVIVVRHRKTGEALQHTGDPSRRSIRAEPLGPSVDRLLGNPVPVLTCPVSSGHA
jgi:hypothetical protein